MCKTQVKNIVKQDKIFNGEKEEMPKAWPQILAILIGSLTSLTVGLLFAWPSPSIPRIINDKINYDITLEEASYFTVIPPVASLTSSILFSKLNDLIGRKYTLMFMAIPQSLAWILIATAKSKWVFYVARLCCGIGDACLFSTLPIYISEIATPKVRGVWGNSMTFFIFFGQFLVNIIGSYFSIKETAYICLVVPLVFVIGFAFMPDSPYFLIMKGRDDDAKASLKRLRRMENVDVELAKIKKDVERQLSESGTWKDLFTIKSNRRALYAGVFLRTAQQFSGGSVFAVYCQYIFLKAGGNVSAESSSMIFSGLCAALNFCAAFTIDRFGRRKSFLYSALLSGLLLVVEFAYFFIDQFYPEVNLLDFRWLPLAGMIVYVFIFSFGLGIVPTLMLGELFSQSIKGKGLCVLNVVFGLLVSSITKLFQVLETNFGLYSPFAFFAVSSFVAAALTMVFVPETKGKTLEEIQQALKGNDPKKKNKVSKS